jgi:hypothetical protein
LPPPSGRACAGAIATAAINAVTASVAATFEPPRLNPFLTTSSSSTSLRAWSVERR